MPNPQRCLQAVNDLMPVLAKSKMQKIIDETNDASYKPWFYIFRGNSRATYSGAPSTDSARIILNQSKAGTGSGNNARICECIEFLG